VANYQQLQLGQRTPWDAVIVTVRRALGRTVADVAAVDQIADFPMPVPRALVEADEMRNRLNLRRIVVVLEDEKLWLPEWGTLTQA
jgi:hypothetical protein